MFKSFSSEWFLKEKLAFIRLSNWTIFPVSPENFLVRRRCHQISKNGKNIRGTRHYTCTCHFSVYKVSASTSSRKFSGLVQKIFWWVQKNFPKLFFKKCLECSDSSKKLKFLRIQTFSHTKWVKILRNTLSYWKIAGLRPAIFRGTLGNWGHP